MQQTHNFTSHLMVAKYKQKINNLKVKFNSLFIARICNTTHEKVKHYCKLMLSLEEGCIETLTLHVDNTEHEFYNLDLDYACGFIYKIPNNYTGITCIAEMYAALSTLNEIDLFTTQNKLIHDCLDVIIPECNHDTEYELYYTIKGGEQEWLKSLSEYDNPVAILQQSED